MVPVLGFTVSNKLASLLVFESCKVPYESLPLTKTVNASFEISLTGSLGLSFFSTFV